MTMNVERLTDLVRHLVFVCVAARQQRPLTHLNFGVSFYVFIFVDTMADKYSILLPTYNERENLPIIIWLIVKYMDERYEKNLKFDIFLCHVI